MIWVALALGWATGLIALLAFNPISGATPRWAALLFLASLGLAVGVGIQSVLLFLLLLAGAASGSFLLIAQLILLGVLGFVLWKRPRHPAVVRAQRWSGLTWSAAGVFVLMVLLIAPGLEEMVIATPHGEWDAWSIWNLRARFLAGPADSWKLAISPVLHRTHPDYPLLLSGAVAMGWRVAGSADPALPLVLGLLVLAANAALLVAWLAMQRGPLYGWLAGIALLASPVFVAQGAAQYADLPLALFVTATVALAMLPNPAAGAWAGVCAGFAAWTKNEGIVVLLLALIVFRRKALLAGAAPMLAVLAFFKFALAPASDPVLHQTASAALARMADPSRYAQIARTFASELIGFGHGVSHPVLILAALLIGGGWRWDRRLTLPAILLAGTFASYLAVFLVTPEDLAWRLSSSAARLLCQLWPAVTAIAILAVDRLENVP